MDLDAKNNNFNMSIKKKLQTKILHQIGMRLKKILAVRMEKALEFLTNIFIKLTSLISNNKMNKLLNNFQVLANTKLKVISSANQDFH